MTRSAIVITMALAATGVLFPERGPLQARFVWNASASAPIGLYRIDNAAKFAVGDLVAVQPPGSLATFLAEREYLPKGVLLLKRILAVSGQMVCRRKLTISVDGRDVGVALERDRAGRDLPSWQGCQRVPATAVFLMNQRVRDSLDGRYFGLVAADHILGLAAPLWTDEQGDGHFQWRAQAR
ncbi:peptidase S26 [Mesorhizobium sp. 131-2-1]|nr:S26 family signal peptidase [Mesorhizobium sp. 131-2-1]BCG96966.1 peptidase S26 [Mesorhizobium sp. 131-2-1]